MATAMTNSEFQLWLPFNFPPKSALHFRGMCLYGYSVFWFLLLWWFCWLGGWIGSWVGDGSAAGRPFRPLPPSPLPCLIWSLSSRLSSEGQRSSADLWMNGKSRAEGDPRQQRGKRWQLFLWCLIFLCCCYPVIITTQMKADESKIMSLSSTLRLYSGFYSSFLCSAHSQTHAVLLSVWWSPLCAVCPWVSLCKLTLYMLYLVWPANHTLSHTQTSKVHQVVRVGPVLLDQQLAIWSHPTLHTWVSLHMAPQQW